jgi:hypothetical protein
MNEKPVPRLLKLLDPASGTIRVLLEPDWTTYHCEAKKHGTWGLVGAEKRGVNSQHLCAGSGLLLPSLQSEDRQHPRQVAAAHSPA